LSSQRDRREDPAGLSSYANPDVPASLQVSRPGVAGARPGIAQLLGAPLRTGQVLTVTGTAGAATTLVTRVAAADGERVVTVGDLGLGRPGTATITATGSPGNPTLRVRSATGKTRPLNTPKATLIKPELAATQQGARLTVVVQAAPRARVRIEMRRGHRIARRLSRRAGAGGTVIVRTPIKHVTTVRARVVRGGRSSPSVSIRPTQAR
jgi:hypothetical protein